MKVSITVDEKRARAKERAMMAAIPAFAAAIPVDACSFMDMGLSSAVLNNQYVRFISGNLLRSVTPIRTGPYEAALGCDESIAPYAKYVRAHTERKYGRDYYRIAFDLFGSKLIQSVTAEYNRLLSVIGAARKYTYRNPFPA